MNSGVEPQSIRTSRPDTTRNTIASAAIGLLGVLLAGWSFVDAFANVARPRNPAMALRLRPDDALALAGAADRAFLANPAAPAVRAASERAARHALDGALLNPMAARLAALRFERMPARLISTLDAAQGLTRHDITTQLQLVEANVAQGRIAGALAGYDHILRRKPVMGETLFPILASAARDPNVAPVLAANFGKGMPWSGFFIDWAVTNDPRLSTLLPVINAAPAIASGLSEGRKQDIVRRLVELKDYAGADAAYRRYSGSARRQGADFDPAGIYAPLDWEVQNGPGVDGSIDTGTGLFHFTLLGDGQGLLLRRLVPVTPGRYRLEIAGSLTGPAAAAVAARVACASDGTAFGSASLHPGRRTVAVDIAVPAGCRFAWLTLDGTTTADEAAEGQLSRFRLVPTPAATSKPAVAAITPQDPS